MTNAHDGGVRPDSSVPSTCRRRADGAVSTVLFR
jgi:hypothetical protein